MNTREEFKQNYSNYDRELPRLCANCCGTDSLHIHHIVPLASGGRNQLSNMVRLCEKCHQAVHRTDLPSLMRKGRERAKKQGKHMGRPSQPKKNIQKALKLYDEREQNGMSVNAISKLTDVPRSTIYYELKKRPEAKRYDQEVAERKIKPIEGETK